MRCERFGQHVRAVGVRAPIVLRSGLSLGIRLDEEAAKIRNVPVNLLDLRAPPGANFRIEWIRGLQSTDFHGCAEPCAQKNAQPIGPKHAGQRRGLLQVCGRQAERTGVDVGEYGAIDTQGCAGARVVDVAGVEILRQRLPVPQRGTGVAAFDEAVEIVPMVEYPMRQVRCRQQGESIDGLACLDQTQPMKHAIQHPDVSIGRDHRRGMAIQLHAAKHIAIVADGV